MWSRIAWVAIVAASIAAAVACSSKHAEHGDGGAPGDGVPAGDDGGGLCGPAVCAGACGSGSACGQPVSCDMCRYDATMVASAYEPVFVATGSGAAPAVAAASGTTVFVRGASGWATEQVTDAMGQSFTGTLTGFAVAPDGTRWLAYSNAGAGAVTIAHGSAAAGWTLDTVGASSFGGGALAIAGDGTVTVAYEGSAPGIQDGLILAHSSGSAGAPWTLSTIVPTETFAGSVALAADPSSGGHGVAIAWDSAAGLDYVTATTGGVAGTVETVDAAAAGTEDQVTLAFDGAGRPHVAYRHDVPLDRAIDHAVRDQGTWRIETIGGGFNGGDLTTIATGANGALSILYKLGDDLFLAQKVNGVWLTQPMYGYCDGGGGLAYLGTTLDVLHDCSGSLVDLVRDGTYPADYQATCTHAAAALCSAACACTSSCCIDDSSGQQCHDPVSNCDSKIMFALCGDPSRDPAGVYACDAAAAMAPACGSDAIAAPAACVLQ